MSSLSRAITISVLAVIGFTGNAYPQAINEELEARVRAIERRLGVVEDVQKIERLTRAYGYYFDKGFWQETTTLFTDDAQVEIAQRGVFKGRQSIQRLYVQLFGRGKNCLPERGLNNHIILQPIVTVNADGLSATGRARILGQIAAGPKDFLAQEGVYNFGYRKIDGIWRISNLHYFGDIYARFPDALEKYPVPQSKVSADVPPDEPPSVAYDSYPGYYVPEFPYANPVTGKIVDVSICNKR